MEKKSNWTKAEYHSALKKIETLMRAAPGSVEDERLRVLSTLVEACERKRFRIELLDSEEPKSSSDLE